MIRQTHREATESPRGPDGVELLHAQFDRHIYDRHMHETYAIGVTLRGVQRFWCRGATRDSLPGDVIVIHPGEAHDGRSGAPGGYAYRMFYVTTALFDSLRAGAGEASPDLGAWAPVLHDPNLSKQLDMCWRAMAAAPNSLAADELLLESVGVLVRRHMGARADRPAPVNEAVLRRVRQRLHEALERPVGLRELADMASMSRFQLTRQFQKRYGLPLHAYHLHLRLEEAKRRLAEGQAISIVAAELGFVDQSHLHRRFKGWFGLTPGQWRAARGYKTA